MKTKDIITLKNSDTIIPKLLIPQKLFLLTNKSETSDTVNIAELLFNPEIKLIDPDTFNLKISLIQPDSALLNRDSTKIIDVHPQDAIMAKVFRIESKDKKSFLVFYGSIRISGAIDFNGLQSEDVFSTYYIPVGEDNSNERRFYMNISQTRFGLQGTNKTDMGPINFHIEGDFRGGQPNLFRIRHAYVHFINFLAGQTWSVFGDPFSIPWTVDIEGPNSSLNQRSVQLRYSRLINNNFRWTVSAETPQVEFIPTDSLSAIYQGLPDLAGRMKYMTKWGHLQASFVFRSLGVSNNSFQPTESIGFGALLSGRYDIKPRRTILFQFVGGQGIARYVTSLKNTQNDLVLNPDKNIYEPLPVFGGYISLGVGWKSSLYSFLTPGFTFIKNKSFLDDDVFNFSAYFSVNTFWDVTKGLRVGAEYSFGTRENKDGQTGSANRASFICYYSF